MKNIISLFVLICSVAVIIVSCAKKEDEKTTATAALSGGSGTSASGTVSGMDNLTGTFHLSFWGQEPSGGCVDNSTAIAVLAATLPSDTLGIKSDIIITSSTTYTRTMQYFSDAGCATITGYMNFLYKNFLVGDNVSGLPSGSNPSLWSTAYKVSYKEQSLNLSCYSDSCMTFFNATYGASNLSALGFAQGTELVVANSDTEVNIWNVGALGGTTKNYLGVGDSHASTYPDNWTGSTVYWQE